MDAYTNYIYEIIKEEAEGLDAVYEDYIISLVGHKGLNALVDARLLETCGVVNGRQLYAICGKE